MIRQSVLVLILLVSGCAYFQPKKAKPARQPTKKSAQSDSKPAVRATSVDPQAQQKYYDQGMRFYSQENYSEAKKSWQQAVQAAPGTALADKARDYLKKTEQVLKTLKEMEKR